MDPSIVEGSDQRILLPYTFESGPSKTHRRTASSTLYPVSTSNGVPLVEPAMSSKSDQGPYSTSPLVTLEPSGMPPTYASPKQLPSPTPSSQATTILHMESSDSMSDDELDADDEGTTLTLVKKSKMPNDRLRCCIAALLMALAGLSNDVVLAFIHERVPAYAPLPDIVFQHTPYVPFALTMSEIAMITNTFMAFAVCILNKHRWTYLKRLLIVSSMLYGGRACSMLVTQVPVADPKYHCAPKLNETSVLLVLTRAASLVSGLGMSMGGKHVLCGDYIYSGHTLVLVHSYLIVCQYTPRRWWPLHWFSATLAMFGVLGLLLSRGHYTVDVLLAYWITTRLFATYHTMCSVPALRRKTHANMLSRFCWWPLFSYMERDVPCKLQMRFEWPLPWPRRLVRTANKSNMY